MLRKLRAKFVGIMMAFVAIMLVVIFGLVIFFMGYTMELQSDRMMQTIADNPFQVGSPFEPSEEIRMPYFVAQISRRGDVVATGNSYYDMSDEASIHKIIQAALRSDEQTGYLEEYDLRYQKISRPTGELIIFADVSSQRTMMKSLISGCLLIGLISIAAFFVISLLLADWAVQPVERAWQQQKQFVADASHELKTPLTVIMTNAELLQNPDYDEVSRQRFSDSIFTMSRQMRGLVEGLLELARVDNGAVKMGFTDVDMSALADEGILPFEPLYFEKGLTLSASIEKGITVHGSASYLRQVLDILLDNAMKYSFPNCRVWVTVKRQGNHCLLSVANPGEHMDAQELKNIFRRFYRMDKARSRNGSYGLGLPIAQSIVEEHRGKIWAESERGINTFYVQLPVN